MPEQQAPAPPMTRMSPTSIGAIDRGASWNLSSELKPSVLNSTRLSVCESPLSQHLPTITYSFSQIPSLLKSDDLSPPYLLYKQKGCWDPQSIGLVMISIPPFMITKVNLSVSLMSITVVNTYPEFPTRKVPGSITVTGCVPVYFPQASTSAFRILPTISRSSISSSGILASLRPPPKLIFFTFPLKYFLMMLIQLVMWSFQISSEPPEPTWMWTQSNSTFSFQALYRRIGRSFKWTPKQEYQSPVFLELDSPAPLPGCILTHSLMLCVLQVYLMSQNCLREQTLNFIPFTTKSFN